MTVSRAEMIALFPTGGAIPEELQIGRSAATAEITAAAIAGSTLIFAEARRLGKSSLLLAMTDRILREDNGRTALSVDLRDGVSDSASLANILLTQADKLCNTPGPYTAPEATCCLPPLGAWVHIRPPAS
jgi:hypothetical protein